MSGRLRLLVWLVLAALAGAAAWAASPPRALRGGATVLFLAWADWRWL